MKRKIATQLAARLSNMASYEESIADKLNYEAMSDEEWNTYVNGQNLFIENWERLLDTKQALVNKLK